MEVLNIGLLTLSNPAHAQTISPFILRLEQNGIHVDASSLLFTQTTPRQRAEEFNRMISSGSYDYVFDVSGGDLASLTLPYLDYEAYGASQTIFCGYSDLTCVLNALNKRTGRPAILFQPVGHRPFDEIIQWLLGKNVSSLFTFEVNPIINGPLQGKVVGGNCRCLLKTAGTPYFPDVKDKVLFLESHSGTMFRIAAFIAQLDQMGVFDQVQGVMFGQFTQLDDAYGLSGSTSLLKEIWLDVMPQSSLPVWRTLDIGHSAGSRAIWIGKNLKVEA